MRIKSASFIQRPVSIVDDNSLFGSARDGIMVLEQPYVAPGIGQEGVIWNGVTPFHARTSRVSHRQTVENFCPSTRKEDKHKTKQTFSFQMQQD